MTSVTEIPRLGLVVSVSGCGRGVVVVVGVIGILGLVVVLLGAMVGEASLRGEPEGLEVAGLAEALFLLPGTFECTLEGPLAEDTAVLP